MSAHLAAIAQKIVAAPKGILAADESLPTLKKRFDPIGVVSTEETRRAYRELLFTCEEAAPYIGGVILFDESLRQQTASGKPFAEVLAEQGTVPGIKVDRGAKPLAGYPGEKITEGLDGLRERLGEYHALGARFAKWRAVIAIGDGIPSGTCIQANAHALARYAALCQEAGIVPIVEPEVLMEGSHTIDRCEEVTAAGLRALFDALALHRVALEGTLLKPNMVISGKSCPTQADTGEIAERTLRCFRRAVPAAIGGIVFLSGGQTEVQATENLNAMNQVGPHPWALSFSYGRALQQSTLKAWLGKPENVAAAQRAYAHRARCNGAARTGSYTTAMEREHPGV